jgi:hypothetical protein
MGNTSTDYASYYNVVRQKEAEYLEAIQSAATITNGERRAKALKDLHDYYNAIWEELTNAILCEKPLKLIKEELRDLATEEVPVANEVACTEAFKEALLKKSDYLRRNGYIATETRKISCIVCDRLIQGIGLIDLEDAALSGSVAYVLIFCKISINGCHLSSCKHSFLSTIAVTSSQAGTSCL